MIPESGCGAPGCKNCTAIYDDEICIYLINTLPSADLSSSQVNQSERSVRWRGREREGRRAKRREIEVREASGEDGEWCMEKDR